MWSVDSYITKMLKLFHMFFNSFVFYVCVYVYVYQNLFILYLPGTVFDIGEIIDA